MLLYIYPPTFTDTFSVSVMYLPAYELSLKKMLLLVAPKCLWFSFDIQISTLLKFSGNFEWIKWVNKILTGTYIRDIIAHSIIWLLSVPRQQVHHFHSMPSFNSSQQTVNNSRYHLYNVTRHFNENILKILYNYLHGRTIFLMRRF